MKNLHISKSSICIAVLAIAIVGVVHLGCESKKPIIIGFIGGTSVRVADLGISGLDAVQLTVEHFNKAGGIGGRRVQLIIRDDQQDPDVAQS